MGWVKSRHLVVVAGALAAAWAHSAAAQVVGAGVTLNRASDQRAPSEDITRVGGPRTGGLTPTPPPRGEVATARFSLGFPRGPVTAGGYVPSPVQIGPIGRQHYQPLLQPRRLDLSPSAFLANFSSAHALNTPLGGWGQPVLPLPDTPLRPPERTGSRFDQRLGLAPAQERPRSSQPVEFEDLTATLEARTQDRIREMERRGLELFREATSGTLEPAARFQKLRRAVRLFDNVRRMDPKANLPCVLIGHACLERAQIGSVLSSLIDAAQRAPEAFRDELDVASYYGDVDEQTGRSRRLEDLMQAAVQSAGRGEETVDARVLEAYCAAVLGQEARARAALDGAEELLREGHPARAHISDLIEALRYALS